MKRFVPNYLILDKTKVIGWTALAFLLALALAILFDRMHNHLLKERELTHLYEHLVQIEDLLEARLRHRLEVTSGLAAYIQLHPKLDQSQFQELAGHLAQASGGLIGVHLLQDDRISHVFPVRHLEVLRDKTIEELYGVQPDGNLVPTPFLRNAMADKNLLVNRHPIRVTLSGDGTEGSEDRQDLWGYVVLLIDVEDVIEQSGLLSEEAPVEIALVFEPMDSREGALVFGDIHVIDEDPLILGMTLPGGRWTLMGVDRGWRHLMAYQRTIMHLFSAVILLLLTVAVYLLLSHVRLHGLISDVEAARSASERQFSFLIREAMVDSIGVFDQDGRILDFNDVAALSLGYTREELARLSVFDIDKGTGEKELRRILAAMRPGHISRVRTMHQRKDGSLCPVEVRLGVMETSEGVRILAVVRDITAQSHYEEELENLNRDKDRFFGIIAHDLRGPLGGFLGLTEILVRDSTAFSPDELGQLAAEMHKAGKSLFDLLEDLLDWSRLRMGRIEPHPEDICLREAVENVFELFAGNARLKEISLGNDCPQELLVKADMEMLATILRNLVSNALKFTPRGGRISIRARLEGSQIVTEVEDSGVGMSSEQVDSLFRIGQSVRHLGTEQEKGSGLGLILCHELVTRQGGTIEIRSTPGKGSVFAFRLPASAA